MRNTMPLTNIFVLMAILAMCHDARAQGAGVGAGRIGNAIDVRGTVESDVQGRAYPLSKGGNVYQDQWVNTRENSVAGLELLDQSKMHIGPKSSVKLDKSKFDPSKQLGVISMRVKAGTEFRLKNERTDRASYRVQDP